MAKSLEREYNPKVRKKIKGKTIVVKVKFTPIAQDEIDDDVDFKVVIAPNDTTVSGAAKKMVPESNITFTQNSDGSPDTVKGDPISKKGKGGSHATGGLRINGWDYVEQLPNFNSNWVRFHVLNAKIHGPAHQKNLVPAPKAANNDYKTDLENSLKDYADAGGVFKFTAKVDYYSPSNNQVNSYDDKNVFRFFPSHLKVTTKTLNKKKGFDKINKNYNISIGAPTNLDSLPIYLYDLSATEMNNLLNLNMDFAEILEMSFKSGRKPTTGLALNQLVQGEAEDADIAPSTMAKLPNWMQKSLLPLVGNRVLLVRR